MEQCLINKKICSQTNRKCKICKLDTCKEVLRMIENSQYYEDLDKLRRIKADLPKECQGCSFLEITNLREQKVHCPYRVKERCLLK